MLYRPLKVWNPDTNTWDMVGDDRILTHVHDQYITPAEGDARYEPVNPALTAHLSDTGNPHSTTKTQVGLGNVDNTSDANKPVSTAQQTALDGKVSHSLATALNDFLVGGGAGAWVKKTVAEVKTILGLGSAAYTASTDYEPANANIQSHISSSANPHSTTKAQVGLGNCDNTSDANKPVSTAQQTALDGKVSHSLATAANDFLIGSGPGAWAKKTLAEVKSILSLGTSASLNAGVDSLELPHVDDLGKCAFMNPEQIAVSLHPVEKTAAYTLVSSDHGRAVFASHASGFTVTLPSAADCAEGWCVPVKASGAGNITVAAAGSDTIDGGASITVTAGTTRWILRYSATAFRSL